MVPWEVGSVWVGASVPSAAFATESPESSASEVPGALTSPLMQWHTQTIDFVGPTLTESGATNPQLDYRLDVTFTSPDGLRSFVVPGYWAADGDAGFTHATSGSTWRAHFSPDEIGTWSYDASFRQGSNVAVGASTSAGVTGGFFDGENGTFEVVASDKEGSDFRAPEHGLIKNFGTQPGLPSSGHYLTHAGGGGVFLKGGPDIPENFLGYDEFDNTPRGAVDLHTFDAHVADWNPGDPTWDSLNDPDADLDEGKAIIGALNFIAERGSNVIYFLPMNLGGDGRDSHPFVSNNPADNTEYDISKLDQWQIVFEHAQSKGVFLHFQLAETEPANENWFDNGTLGDERKLFYRMMIARYGHLPGLQWDLGEENDFGAAKHAQFASFIKSVDPYDHPLTTHTKSNQWDNFYEPLRGNADFDMTGFQGGNFRFGQPENEIEEWRRKSDESGVRWVISVDEPQKIENDKTDPNNGYPHGRTDFLWPIYLSGGGGFEWYVQEDGAGHTFDQRIDDFNDMDVALEWTGYAIDFLTGLPLQSMTPDKTLGRSDNGETTFVLHDPGEVYALYDANGGEMEVDLTNAVGVYEVQFFNPRTGELSGVTDTFLGGGWQSLGTPPNTPSNDWAAVVRRVEDAPNQAPEVSISTVEELPGDAGNAFFLEATVNDDGQLLPTTSLQWSLVSGPFAGVATFSAPQSEDTEVEFSRAGTYVVRLTAFDGELSGTATQQVVVTSTGNEPPILDAGPDQVIVQPSNTATLAATATDEGQLRDLVYFWRFVSGPSTGRISNPFSPTVEVTVGGQGSYVFEVSANDGEFEVTDQVTVRVSDGVNDSPDADITGFQPSPGVPGRYRLMGAATDPDDDPLLLDWEILSGPGSVSQWTGKSTTDAEATFSQNGGYLVRFTASDGLATATDTRTLFVTTVGGTTGELRFSPIDDAYVQGTVGLDDSFIKTESGARTGYFKFSVTGVSGTTATSSKLQLVVAGAGSETGGNGPLTLYAASEDAWSEQTLNAANAPTIVGAPLGTVTGSFGIGQIVEFDLASLINGDGVYSFVLQHSGSNDVWFSSKEGADAPELVVSVVAAPPTPAVVDRRVFYNDTVWDGVDPGLNPDDDLAIAPDKAALLPGQIAGFANYVTGPAGLTGLMIDLADLADPNSLSPDDFAFRTGRDTDLASWPQEGPVPTDFDVRLVGGVYRVLFAFAPGAVFDEWLEVKVLDTPATGLAAADTFFFGSVPGDTGNALLDTVVDLADAQGLAANLRPSDASIGNPYDLNRDGAVDSDDMIVLAANATNQVTQARLIAVSPDATQLTAVPLLRGDFSGDGIVNAIDYTAWRDTRGSNGLAFAGADATGDGLVDNADRAVLYANYYATLTAEPLLTEAEALALLPMATATRAVAPEPGPVAADPPATVAAEAPTRGPFRTTARGPMQGAPLAIDEALLLATLGSPGIPSPPAATEEDPIESDDRAGPDREATLGDAFADWF